jgi:arylsulfatase A-like enzyme
MRMKLTTQMNIFLVFIAVLVSGCAEIQKKQPNIIFIFADDQCYNTINALGNKEIITPTLDRMVMNGVSFTHAYNMGGWSGAVCVASRSMMNTGLSIWNAKSELKNLNERVANRQMWSQLMEDAGYETYLSGKWHVPVDASKIFNHVAHIRGGMPNQSKTRYQRSFIPDQSDWKPYDTIFGGYWKGGKHWSEVVGDDATHFLGDAAKKDNPFFMYIAFNAPHDPRQSPKKYVDLYPLENIEIPENFLPAYPYHEEMGSGKNLRDEQLAPFPRTEYAVQVNRQEYYAIITHMDAQINRILKTVDKSGKKDNTYIFFSADHGLAVGQHGLLGKQSLFDHSIRPPMIIIGPDVPKDKKLDHDVYLQDIMASVLDLAGIEKPAYIEFNSLMPYVRDEANQRNYDAIYGAYINLQRMIRKNDYKLILYPAAKKAVLFNLKNDPNEMYDLSNDSIYLDLKKRLFKDLLKMQIKMNDTLDLTVSFSELIE